MILCTIYISIGHVNGYLPDKASLPYVRADAFVNFYFHSLCTHTNDTRRASHLYEYVYGVLNHYASVYCM